MERVAQRELRNDIASVLRRVEAGARLEVTVDGRPVAVLSPLPRRRRRIAAAEIWERILATQADPALRDDLARLFPDTTDDTAPA